MTQFVTEDHWAAIGKDLKGPRPPVTAVVSFIGATGDSLLPLRKGDRLVCNADVDTVRLGLTNPTTLQRFLTRGVQVFSVRGLHAKVVVGDDFAWVGSANASDSGLLEATVRLGPTAARPIRTWADDLCREPWKLTATAIQNLKKEKVRRIDGPPPPLSSPDPREITRLQLWWLDDLMSAEAEEAAEEERTRSSVSRKEAAFMNSLSYTEVGPDDTSIDEGDWLVPFYGGEPSSPAQVVRVTPHPNFRIVWFRHVDVPRVPTLEEIEQVIPEWWEQEDDSVFLLKNQRKLSAFLDLYS